MGSGRQEQDLLGLQGHELLGRYTVEATIAHGGMSVVYQGHDTRLRRAVCVKVFHRLDPRHPAYRTTWEHFVQEAFALSQLTHPNTLRIYDFGYLEHEPRSPFQVCEFLDGGTLSQQIRREGPLAPRAALEILEPVIGALSEAHSRGIVHRDIKPNNVLFGNAGTRRIVKLVDFGIAKALPRASARLPHQAEDTADAAGEQVNLFTPGWAAPEQMTNAPIGPTADVFSLGLLVAYVLTGKTIFSARAAAVLMIRADADVEGHIARRLGELALDPVLAQVVARACRHVPDERYESVDALGAALHDAVLSAEPITGRQSFLPAGHSSISPGSIVPPGSMPRPAPASAPHPERMSPLPPERTSTPPPEGTTTPVSPVASPAPAGAFTPAAPVLFLGGVADGEMLAAGRRVRVLAIDEQIDLGGRSGFLSSPARVRLTLLPSAGDRVRLHVKGLNCFVARSGERPSPAASLDTDTDLELMSPDRRRLDVLRCLFGELGGDASQSFHLGAVTLAVPRQMYPAIILDVGPGRELGLLHGTRAVAMDGGRR